MIIPDAKVTVGKSWDKLETHRPQTSRKSHQSHKWFNRRSRTGDLFISHPSWTSAISNTSSLRKISKHTKGVSCKGGKTSNTTVETGASASQVAEARFVEYNLQAPWRVKRKPHTDYRAIQRVPASVDKTTTQSKIEFFGTRLTNQWFSLSENYTITPLQDCSGNAISKKYFSHEFG